MAETTHWRIVRQLPRLHTQIVDRMVTDTEFRGLCQDYDDCAIALERFQNEADILPDRIREYERLLAALEADIRDVLSANNKVESK